MISGKTLLAAAAVILLGSIGISNAQTTAPATQGLNSVDKNLAKDPDNRGLENAQDRHERNQLRQETREKADRNDVARLERPERPDRPERGR